jgi:hypothetical protein
MVLGDQAGRVGAQRRLQLRHLGIGAERLLDVLDRSAVGGVVGRQRPGLDENHLRDLLLDRLALRVHREPGVADDAIGRARLADGGVLLVDLLGAGHPADGE